MKKVIRMINVSGLIPFRIYFTGILATLVTKSIKATINIYGIKLLMKNKETINKVVIIIFTLGSNL